MAVTAGRYNRRQANGRAARAARRPYSAPHNGVRDVTAETSISRPRADRGRRDPLRRRLRRRHADRRRPLHRRQRHLRQRPRDAAELPGRDPRAGGDDRRACRRSRCTSPTTTSSRPGDAPNVLVAMNPAALKANLAEMPPGVHAARELRRVRRAQPREGRLRGQPARRRLARRRSA